MAVVGSTKDAVLGTLFDRIGSALNMDPMVRCNIDTKLHSVKGTALPISRITFV